MSFLLAPEADRPERTYEVRTYVEGGFWQIQVVDETTTNDVKSPCKERP
jgi:hypothetical protein